MLDEPSRGRVAARSRNFWGSQEKSRSLPLPNRYGKGELSARAILVSRRPIVKVFIQHFGASRWVVGGNTVGREL
jgi:hypothetical protein